MLKYGLTGATLGAGIGLATSKKGKRTKSIMAGATLGAGAGVGLKYGKTKYKRWIQKGAPKRHTYDPKNYKEGDIMIVRRSSGIDHYGVYTGDGKVIEYGSPVLDPRKAQIREVSLNEFGLGDAVRTEAPNGKFTREEIVKRAKERYASGKMGNIIS